MARRLVHVFAVVLLGLVMALPSSGHATQILGADEAFVMKVERRADGALVAKWTVADGYYLYRDHTVLTYGEALTPLGARLSAGVETDDPGFGPVSVWYRNGEAVVSRQTLEAAGPPASVTLTYQGCLEGSICYPPVTKTVGVPSWSAPQSTPVAVPVEQPVATEAATDEPVAGVTVEAEPVAAGASPEKPEGEQQTEVATASLAATMVETLEDRGGKIWVLLAFFGFGVLLAFTPCVFPMYPILAGVIGRDASGTRRGFVLSAAYVLGLASAFAVLGFVAAWSGQNMQVALQAPWVIAGVAAVFVLLAVSMFGGYDLSLPSWWTNRFHARSDKASRSYVSAVTMGFGSALIVGPCVTAPLAGALLYIARSGDVALGGAALFALGLGKGVPLILFGTVGAKILPKAGAWMGSVKTAFGFVFLAMGWWLLSRILPPAYVMVSGALLAFAVWAALGRLACSGHALLAVMCRAAGVLALCWGAIWLIGAASGASDPWRPLSGLNAGRQEVAETYPLSAVVDNKAALQAALARASARKSVAVVYFTADWCVTCRAIERDVLPDPQIVRALADVDLIKVDVTSNSPEVRQMMTDHSIIGPPTLLFFKADGLENASARRVGTVTREGMVEALMQTQVAP